MKIFVETLGTILSPITIFLGRVVRPDSNLNSYSTRNLARVAFNTTAAKNRPGHAYRPSPKCMFVGPVLTSPEVGLPSFSNRKASKRSGSGMMAGSREIGPAAIQMCVPRGRKSPSDRVRSCLTILWKETDWQYGLISGFVSRSKWGGLVLTLSWWVEALRLLQEAIHLF